MKKQWIALTFVVLIFVVGIGVYSRIHIKRDVPILIENEPARGLKSANVKSNDFLIKGVAYEIDEKENHLLLIAPAQTDNTLIADKEYLTTMVYEVGSTEEPAIVNFDMATHVSACFEPDMAGIYYVTQSTQNEATARQLLYVTMDKTRLVRISKPDELVSTGVIMSGDWAIYGTSKGEIKLGKASADEPVLLYDLSEMMGENYAITKIRHFQDENIIFVSAQKDGSDKTSLFAIKKNRKPELLAESIIDFDANEVAGIAVYIEVDEAESRLFSYSTASGEKRELHSGSSLYCVALNAEGSMLVYGERTTEGGLNYNIHIMMVESGASAKLLSEVRLSNRKILWGKGNTLYLSMHSVQESSNSILLSDIYRCKFTITTQ